MSVNAKKQLCFKNDGVTSNDKIQNKFTSYINCAMRRSRNKYLKHKIRHERMMLPILDYADILGKSSTDCENLKCIIFCLNEREQTILHEHVIMKQTHLDIAEKLSMTLSAVQKAYQRLMRKLRYEVEA